MTYILREEHGVTELPPETPAVKEIAILSVYYSGASKKMSLLEPHFKTALVNGHFPGDSGCAVVKGPGNVWLYPSLGAGVRGWRRLE